MPGAPRAGLVGETIIVGFDLITVTSNPITVPQGVTAANLIFEFIYTGNPSDTKNAVIDNIKLLLQ